MISGMADDTQAGNDVAAPAAVMVRHTLSDQVADAVVELIFQAGLRPGDAMPTERVLEERLGVSRIVVREAMRTLRACQIVDGGQGRAARVRVPDGALLGRLFDYSLRQHAIAFADLLATRRTIEAELAAAAAVAGLSHGAERRARATLADMAAAQGLDDVDEFTGADLAFHYVIADAADNALLALLLRGMERLLLAARVSTHRRRLAEGRSVLEVVDAHRRILDAILARDPVAARAAMIDHLEQTAADAPRA